MQNSENTRQAVLITAYHNFDLLYILLEHLSSYFNCYVHIDKKSRIPASFDEQVQQLNNVFIVQKYRVNWGSYNHLKAFLLLLSYAEKDDCSFFHLIPADTFPLKSFETIEKKIDYTKNYIEICDNDVECIERQRLFFLNNVLDCKKSYSKKLIAIQRKFNVFRKIKYTRRGYVYCSINKETANYAIGYFKRHPLQRLRFKTINIPEEFFFQNLIFPRFSECTINIKNIYDIWLDEASGPSVLERTEIDEAFKSDKWFIRKIDSTENANYILDKL